MNLASHPRQPLAFLLTSPEALSRLGGPTPWVKRDDMTGVALGGNKARRPEHLLGATQAERATVVMTTAGAASTAVQMAGVVG